MENKWAVDSFNYVGVTLENTGGSNKQKTLLKAKDIKLF
jgi:hypothetical protein